MPKPLPFSDTAGLVDRIEALPLPKRRRLLAALELMLVSSEKPPKTPRPRTPPTPPVQWMHVTMPGDGRNG